MRPSPHGCPATGAESRADPGWGEEGGKHEKLRFCRTKWAKSRFHLQFLAVEDRVFCRAANFLSYPCSIQTVGKENQETRMVRLVPRDTKYFDMFAEQATNILQ